MRGRHLCVDWKRINDKCILEHCCDASPSPYASSLPLDTFSLLSHMGKKTLTHVTKNTKWSGVKGIQGSNNSVLYVLGAGKESVNRNTYERHDPGKENKRTDIYLPHAPNGVKAPASAKPTMMQQAVQYCFWHQCDVNVLQKWGMSISP